MIGLDATCPVGITLIALAPGLLNLVPIWWLRASDTRTRSAAKWASVLGGLRLVMPAIAVMLSGSSGAIVATGIIGTFPNAGSQAVLVISLLLWLSTFPVLWGISRIDT